MSLLAAEILMAALALRRGWRLAPLLLAGLPLAARGDALAHGLALAALALACCGGPAQLAALAGRTRAKRRAGPLYQI